MFESDLGQANDVRGTSLSTVNDITRRRGPTVDYIYSKKSLLISECLLFSH